MNRLFAVLVALLLAASVAAETTAQIKQEPMPPPSAPGRPEGPPVPGKEAEKKEVEGKIKSVDPSGKMVTLENGIQLMIPDSVKVNRNALKEGATVKASYEEKGGQKVVTTIEVRPEKKDKKS